MTDYDLICDWCHDYPPQQPGSWLCDSCRDQIHEDLHAILGSPNIPGLMTELNTELAKQGRKGSGGKTTSPEPGLPYSPEASECITRLRHALLRACTITHGDLPPVANTIPDLAEWLLAHEEGFAFTGGSGTAADDIHEQTRTARRIIDTPPERATYLGLCDVCDAPMRANRDHGTYQCLCGLHYDIQTRADAQQRRLTDPDNLVTQMQAAEILGVTPNAIKQRVKHRGLAPCRGEGKGAWYWLGELA